MKNELVGGPFILQEEEKREKLLVALPHILKL
jgi:hypothetical protein